MILRRLTVSLMSLDEVGIKLSDAERILELFRELYERTPQDAIAYLKEYGFNNKQILEVYQN